MNWIKMDWAKLFVLLILGVLAIAGATALPSGPSSATVIGSTTYGGAGAANLSAIAGNVTEVNFAGVSTSQTWQGYFGNVTGTIVLSNAQNQSLYNWALASPSGQVYATRTASVPAWTSIRCANASEIVAEDTVLGVNESTAQDSVNKTFLNTTAFNQFYVGGAIINTTQNCAAVNLNNGTGPSTNFQEVLLSDNANRVYTSLLTKDSNGFDNRTHDFEMLVGENGHLGDTTATPYYFYLELQ